jgi:hypothetical protein
MLSLDKNNEAFDGLKNCKFEHVLVILSEVVWVFETLEAFNIFPDSIIKKRKFWFHLK